VTAWEMTDKELKKLAKKVVANVDDKILSNTVKILRSLDYVQVLDVKIGCYKSVYSNLTEEQKAVMDADPILCRKPRRDSIMAHTRTLSRDRNPSHRMQLITSDDVLCLLIDNSRWLPSLLDTLVDAPGVVAIVRHEVPPREHDFKNFILSHIREGSR